MQSLSEYLSRWRLKLSTAKTTTTAFHLHNRDTLSWQLFLVTGRWRTQNIPSHRPTTINPAFLVIHSLTSPTTVAGLPQSIPLHPPNCKVNARNGLLRCLAGSSWGAYTSTLRTGALALVYSADEYASPAWCRSTHTRKLDVALNDTMRIITGCMRPTETTFLPVLAGITPAPCDPFLHVRHVWRPTTTAGLPRNPFLYIVQPPSMLAFPQIHSFTSPTTSADTRPNSVMTITILPRRGVIASIAVHPSFGQPALSLDLCYLLGQISTANSGWNWIACVVAPRVLATR